MADHDHPRGTVSLESSHRSKPGFEASVVGLQGVVRVDLGVMEGRREQLIEDPGVDPVLVGGDLGGRDAGPADGVVEELPGRLGVPAR